MMLPTIVCIFYNCKKQKNKQTKNKKKTNNSWQQNTKKKTDNTIIKKDKQWLAT
jgi:hypothetical protein